VIIEIGIGVRKGLVGLGNLITNAIEIAEEGDVEKSIAFIREAFIGPSNDDALVAGDDGVFIPSEGIGHEAEGGSCLYRDAERNEGREETSDRCSFPIALFTNDRLKLLLWRVLFFREEIEVPHDAENPLETMADGGGVEPECFAAFKEDHGLAIVTAKGAEGIGTQWSLEDDGGVENAGEFER
jgi:hypothetical protein